MKVAKILMKLAAAVALIGGIVYLVVRYYDKIKAWIQKFCPCCALEEDFVEENEDTAPSAVPEDEDEDEDVPVADDADFAE